MMLYVISGAFLHAVQGSAITVTYTEQLSDSKDIVKANISKNILHKSIFVLKVSCVAFSVSER